MANILIVDDDNIFSKTVDALFTRMGHNCEISHSIINGLEKSSTSFFDVVLLDVGLPDGNGLNEIQNFCNSFSSPEIIIITGAGDPEGAEMAIKSGAWDYLEKGSSPKDIKLSLTRALQYRKQKTEKKPPVVLKRDNVIGNSPKINACLDIVAQAAHCDANVMLTGETGTGKEVFARTIHENSPRKSGNFVVVDCTALPENLCESILFGHEKGVFTGAEFAKDGLVYHANEGTLFLDEIGELPLSIQKIFLRVLQEKKYRPIGSKREIRSNFRLLAATNRNLNEMVKQNKFREDLLFRIHAITIELPPLRERLEDISDIISYHVNEVCKLFGYPPKGFSPDFIEALAMHKWPGNIRELINTLDRVLANAFDEPVLFPRHLPTSMRVQAARKHVEERRQQETGTPIINNNLTAPIKMKAFLDSMKANYLNDLMNYTNGDIRQACKISGLSRSHLYQLLKTQGIRM